MKTATYPLMLFAYCVLDFCSGAPVTEMRVACFEFTVLYPDMRVILVLRNVLLPRSTSKDDDDQTPCYGKSP